MVVFKLLKGFHGTLNLAFFLVQESPLLIVFLCFLEAFFLLVFERSGALVDLRVGVVDDFFRSLNVRLPQRNHHPDEELLLANLANSAPFLRITARVDPRFTLVEAVLARASLAEAADRHALLTAGAAGGVALVAAWATG